MFYSTDSKSSNFPMQPQSKLVKDLYNELLIKFIMLFKLWCVCLKYRMMKREFKNVKIISLLNKMFSFSILKIIENKQHNQGFMRRYTQTPFFLSLSKFDKTQVYINKLTLVEN